MSRAALLVVVLALGLAGCGGDEQTSASTNNAPRDSGDSGASGTFGPHESPDQAPEPVEQSSVKSVPPPPPKGSSGEVVNVIGENLPERLVEMCEEDPMAQEDCGLVLAVAAGEIPPGKYSTPELKELLRDAGYDDDF